MFTLHDRKGGINAAIATHKQLKKVQNFHPLKRKVKRILSNFKFGKHFWRSETNYYRELRMGQSVVHYSEIFVKDWNSMNFVLLNVLKD